MYATLQELFADHSRWTQGAEAKSECGDLVTPTSKHAVRWCLVGALWKCYPNPCDRFEAKKKLLDQLRDSQEIRDRANMCSLENWNDASYRTHDDVVALVKKAGV